MPIAQDGVITKINYAANIMELVVHIYYRTMKFSKGNFSTALHIRDHSRTVHCSVMTLLKILQVWQIEAPYIWRFLSQANLLSLSLRIYSLYHTLSAPSPQHRMWHYLFFMILAGTQKSKREMGAAVQEWESKVQFSYLFQDPFHLPSPPMFGFSQRRFLLLSFSSRSLAASWATCCRSLSFLSLNSTPRAVARNSWLEIPTGNPTNYW